MAEEQVKAHLDALKEYISDIQNGAGNLDDIRIKKKQLSAIQRTIRQLEKNNVPIPKSLSNEKLSLVSEINDMENSSSGCLQIYQSLTGILFDLGRACCKNPHKDLYQMSKKWRSQATPRSEDEIFEFIENQFGSQFTPADISRPGGKNLKWQNNTRRERKVMIKEKILTEDSKGKTWTLNK